MTKFHLFIVLFLAFFSCNNKDDSVTDDPTEVPLTERMFISVEVSENSLSVKLPITGTVNCNIDWNDGNDEPVTKSYPTHTYTKGGKYLIIISGKVSTLNSNDLNENELLCITGVYNWGKTGLTSMNSAFKGCTNLTYLANDADLGAFTNITDFSNAFYECSNLKEIPSGLFTNCTQVVSFNSTFYGCSTLEEIPSGLFENCSQVTSFNETFSNCSILPKIPSNTFDNCIQAYDFEATFKNCIKLSEIPTGLFDNCTLAYNMGMTFQNCENLKEIPIGIFDKCTQINSFLLTFAGCKNLQGESPYTIIEGNKIHLYERIGNIGGFVNPQYSYFCFSECTSLSDFSNIPDGWK